MKTTTFLKAAALVCAAITVPVSGITASAETAPELEELKSKCATIICTEDENGKSFEVTFDEMPEDGTPFKCIMNGEEIEPNSDGVYEFDDGGLTLSMDFTDDSEDGSVEPYIYDGARVYSDVDGEWEDIELTDDEQQAIRDLEDELNSIYDSLPEITEGNEEAYKAAYMERAAEITALQEKISDIFMNAADIDSENPDTLCAFSFSVTQDEESNVQGKVSKCAVYNFSEDDAVCDDADLTGLDTEPSAEDE